MMSQLVRISNHLFRRCSRGNIQSGSLLRHYSQATDDGIKVSRKGKYIFAACFGVAATAFALYIQKEKEYAMMKEREKALKKLGMGGEWKLIDGNGNKRSSEEFKGKWSIIYFGFTHCPDICPDEMEKMTNVVNGLEKQNIDLQPIFITIDPDRDTKEVVGKYVKEFSDKIIGLTGTMDEIKKVCHAYNVYFKAGPKDPSDDYIVDHTIILYLIDPNGQFVDYYGTSKTPDEIMLSIRYNMNQWLKLHDGRTWLTRLIS